MKPNSVVLKSLAAVCWKLVAAAPYRSFLDQAVALHSDWRALTARYASAGYTVELNRQMEAEALDLAQRMIALAEKCLGI